MIADAISCNLCENARKQEFRMGPAITPNTLPWRKKKRRSLRHVMRDDRSLRAIFQTPMDPTLVYTQAFRLIAA
jgi:hypothetical protein